MRTKLILIRHGQTEWNRKRRYSGFVDIDLDKTGVTQVKKLSIRLKKEKIDAVYSSDRKRAVSSAKIIFNGRRIEKIPGLREINFGVFEGLTYKQITSKYPAIYKRWLANPFKAAIPHGETLAKLKKRVVAAINKIVFRNRGKTIAIVFHGGATSIFINYILKKRDFWKYIPSSASLTIVEYNNKTPKLKSFNDTKHL